MTEENTTSRYLPKRLLDVGVGTQSEPRLIDGQQAEVPRYAALSYCWGSVEESKNQLKLTTETRYIFRDSISLSAMTPVLRDAITACKALGLRYLWIDSLCIQQDGDSTDWEEQSQEMSHIFGNSWITICAPASNSCLDGFLDHPDRHSRAIQIEYVSEESGQVQGSIFLHLLTLNGNPGLHNSASITRLTPLMRDLECSNWQTRGWVFQERILSPRLLYFGARMIHFQQGDLMTSEDGSSMDGNFFDHRFFAMRHCCTNLLRQLEVIQNQGPFIPDLWYRLVTVISAAAFTDQRDTFPAIAGIARRVHEFTKYRYLAGLWEEDLCCGLLWMSTPNTRDRNRPRPASLRQLLRINAKTNNLIAPSWSWASTRLPVEFMITNQINITCRVRRHLRAEFVIQKSCVSIDGVNPYGRINNASISLSGLTMSLTRDSPAPMQRVGFNLLLCEVLPDLCIFFEPDWTPVLPSDATGLKSQMGSQLQLLLISSCCSGRSISNNTPAAHSPPHEDHTEPGRGPAHRPTNRWPGINKTPREGMEEKYREAMRYGYRNSFYEDSHPGFDAALHCGRCSDHTLRRDVWGLVLYPAGPPDTFYRVGAFYSRAEHGGSAVFAGVRPRRIELV